MAFSSDADRRFDSFKLDGDLRDAYVELLSAQYAVERMRQRYQPEEVASKGSSFMLARSISAAIAICDYFGAIQRSLPPQAGPPPQRNRTGSNSQQRSE